VKENPSMLLVLELITQYEKVGFNMFLPQDKKGVQYNNELNFEFLLLEVSVQECNEMYKKFPVSEDHEFIFGIIILIQIIAIN